MLKALVLFIFLVVTGNCSEAAVCQKHDFPNYFEVLESAEAKDLITQSFTSILRRLKITHVDPSTKTIKNDRFFEKLNALAEEMGVKAYIAGGMVRSLLGYIYKKLYHADERGGLNLSGEPLSKRDMVLQSFGNIITGDWRSGALLEDFGYVHYLDNPRDVAQIIAKFKRHPPREDQKIDLASDVFGKNLEALNALGVGSDYDVLVDFPDGFVGDRKAVLAKLESFINSAESSLGLSHGSSSAVKKSVIPRGDVQDYQEQIEGPTGTVRQGGSTLDWMAFSVGGDGFRFPKAHPTILDDFLRGSLVYLQPEGEIRDSDKQTIRGLRALLEIPFLIFTPESAERIRLELQALIDRKEDLSFGALEQLEKMVRNARFEGAHNRFTSSIPCMPDAELVGLVQTLSTKLKRSDKNLPSIPTFLTRTKIAARTRDKGNLAQDGFLMNIDYFFRRYTDNGVLYHGTPDIKNILYMIRNGLVVSSQKQGRADFGQGVYTSKDKQVSQGYTAGGGIVLSFKVKALPNLRIVDLNSAHGIQLLEKIKREKPARDPNEVLARDFDVDIIIAAEVNHVLLQNEDAIELPKDTMVLVKASIQEIVQGIKEKLRRQDLTAIDLEYYLEYLHPNRGYSKLAKIMDPSFETQENFELFVRYVHEYLQRSTRDALHESSYVDDRNSTGKLLRLCFQIIQHEEDLSSGPINLKERVCNSIKMILEREVKDPPKKVYTNYDAKINFFKKLRLEILTYDKMFFEKSEVGLALYNAAFDFLKVEYIQKKFGHEASEEFMPEVLKFIKEHYNYFSLLPDYIKFLGKVSLDPESIDLLKKSVTAAKFRDEDVIKTIADLQSDKIKPVLAAFLVLIEEKIIDQFNPQLMDMLAKTRSLESVIRALVKFNKAGYISGFRFYEGYRAREEFQKLNNLMQYLDGLENREVFSEIAFHLAPFFNRDLSAFNASPFSYIEKCFKNVRNPIFILDMLLFFKYQGVLNLERSKQNSMEQFLTGIENDPFSSREKLAEIMKKLKGQNLLPKLDSGEFFVFLRNIEGWANVDRITDVLNRFFPLFFDDEKGKLLKELMLDAALESKLERCQSFAQFFDLALIERARKQSTRFNASDLFKLYQESTFPRDIFEDALRFARDLKIWNFFEFFEKMVKENIPLKGDFVTFMKDNVLSKIPNNFLKVDQRNPNALEDDGWKEDVKSQLLYSIQGIRTPDYSNTTVWSHMPARWVDGKWSDGQIMDLVKAFYENPRLEEAVRIDSDLIGRAFANIQPVASPDYKTILLIIPELEKLITRVRG